MARPKSRVSLEQELTNRGRAVEMFKSIINEKVTQRFDDKIVVE